MLLVLIKAFLSHTMHRVSELIFTLDRWVVTSVDNRKHAAYLVSRVKFMHPPASFVQFFLVLQVCSLPFDSLISPFNLCNICDILEEKSKLSNNMVVDVYSYL